MMGSRRSSDQTNWRIAQECNVAVVSPEYRMAPEHQYPSGHDDCEAVAVWLLEHGAAELGSDRLLIGGESAGGHIAAVTVLRLRDRHEAADRLVRRQPELWCVRHHRDTEPTRCPHRRTTSSPSGAVAAGRARSPTSTPPPTSATLMSRPSSPTSAVCALRCSRWAPATRCSTTVCSWQPAGSSPATRPQLAVYPSGPHGVTGSESEMGRRAQARVEDFIRAHAKR